MLSGYAGQHHRTLHMGALGGGSRNTTENIIIIIIFLHGLGLLTCSDIDALPCASLLMSTLFSLGGLPAHPQNPHSWRTSLSLLVWLLSYGLSGLGGPTRNIKFLPAYPEGGRKKWSWTPQEKMATRRSRNRSNDLIHGGRWWWWIHNGDVWHKNCKSSFNLAPNISSLFNPLTPEIKSFRATLPAEIFYWGF
jgi:hypothetical protein